MSKRSLILLAVCMLSVWGAVAIERVAVSQGISDARADIVDAGISDAGAGSAVPAAVTITVDTRPPAAAPPVDPEAGGIIREIFDFIRSGKGRLAAGSVLVLIVMGLRNKNLLGRYPWFATTFGGYVLGFSTTMLLYLSTMLGSEAPLTLNVIGDAIATAFAASGKWEALRDMLTSMKKQIPPAGVAAAGATAMLLSIPIGCYLMISAVGACTP